MVTIINLQPGTRINWFRVISDIERTRLSQRKLAERLSVPRARIVSWKLCNAEPRFADGGRLITVWSQVTGRSIEHIPVKQNG